ncbi:MAG: CBS domain-containing protein [Planctomycetota bacterium]|jgi:Mg/Co/Ni transporter MgtE
MPPQWICSFGIEQKHHKWGRRKPFDRIDLVVMFAGMSLSDPIRIVSSTDSFYHPVVDNDKKLMGAVTLDGIRNTFTTQELNDWLVAPDITEPIIARMTPNAALSEAFQKARRLDIAHLPVATSEEEDRFIGLLNCRAVRRSLSAEVLSRQQKTDNIQKDTARNERQDGTCKSDINSVRGIVKTRLLWFLDSLIQASTVSAI